MIISEKSQQNLSDYLYPVYIKKNLNLIKKGIISSEKMSNSGLSLRVSSANEVPIAVIYSRRHSNSFKT